MYPDSPNKTVSKLRDGLLRLFRAGRFDEAADYALALTEAAARFSPVDAIADRIARRRPQDAAALYTTALESARWIASGATSGAEGSAYLVEVRRLEAKLARIQKRGGVAPRRRRS